MTREPLAPERVAVLRRRAWRVLLAVAVPVALALAGIGAYAGRWLFVPVGVAFGFFLGGTVAGLLTTPTVLGALSASMTVPGLAPRRARQVVRAISRDRPDLLGEEEVAAARRYAEVRLRVRDLSWPSTVLLVTVPVLLLPVLLAAEETSTWLVVLAASTWVLVPLMLVGLVREGRSLRRFLRTTSSTTPPEAADGPDRG